MAACCGGPERDGFTAISTFTRDGRWLPLTGGTSSGHQSRGRRGGRGGQGTFTISGDIGCADPAVSTAAPAGRGGRAGNGLPDPAPYTNYSSRAWMARDGCSIRQPIQTRIRPPAVHTSATPRNGKRCGLNRGKTQRRSGTLPMRALSRGAHHRPPRNMAQSAAEERHPSLHWMMLRPRNRSRAGVTRVFFSHLMAGRGRKWWTKGGGGGTGAGPLSTKGLHLLRARQFRGSRRTLGALNFEQPPLPPRWAEPKWRDQNRRGPSPEGPRFRSIPKRSPIFMAGPLWRLYDLEAA